MSRKVFAIVVMLVSVLTLTFGGLTSNAATFSDIEYHWGKNVVEEMAKKGIVNGFPDGTFKPDEKVTREQFAKLLVETLKITDYTTNVEFEDVEESRWSKDYIYRACKYLTGYKNNGKYFFKPTESTVREDVAVAVVQAKGLQNEKPDYTLLNQFSDSGEISKDIRKYVAIAVKNGVMKGKGGYFDPQGSLTRAEVSQLMYNVLEKFAIGELKEVLYGDINSDGVVDTKDVTTIQKYVNRQSVKINKEAADVNLDGKVDIADSLIMLKYVSKWSGFEKLPHDCKKTYKVEVKQVNDAKHKLVYICGCGLQLGETEEEHKLKDNKCTKCGYEEKVLYGDINSDGVVDTKDVTTIRKYVNGQSVKIDKEAADVNLDGKVDIADSLIMLKYVSKWSGFEKLPHDCKKAYKVEVKQVNDAKHKLVYICGCGLQLGETEEEHKLKDNKCTKCEYKKEILYGDVNGDGLVNTKDVLCMQKYVNGQSVEIDKEAADVNLDGKVDSTDSEIILKHVSGWSGFEKLPLK